MILVNRVDDRLIHGQVAVSWIRSNNIQVAIVVDDDLVHDELQKSILKMATPAGVKSYIMSVDKFLQRYNEGVLDKYNTMLIFKDVKYPLALVKKGLKMEALNIGGMSFKQGKRRISKSISVSEADEANIRELIALGVDVEHRQLFTDKSVKLEALL